MKILVTGATGFVGNHLINALLNNPINKNIKIIATSTSKERAKHFDWYNFVNFIEFNYDELTEINYYDFFEKPDLLIHLAWKGLPNYENFNHIENNLLQHYSFLKNIISNGLTNITCVGTCFEYGMVNGEMSCNRVTNPSNYYAIAKDTLRKTLFNLKKDYNFDLKWLRLFYIYGNGQSSTSLYSQLLKSIKSGD